jgi:hypothetical protein
MLDGNWVWKILQMDFSAAIGFVDAIHFMIDWDGGFYFICRIEMPLLCSMRTETFQVRSSFVLSRAADIGNNG